MRGVHDDGAGKRAALRDFAMHSKRMEVRQRRAAADSAQSAELQEGLQQAPARGHASERMPPADRSLPAGSQTTSQPDEIAPQSGDALSADVSCSSHGLGAASSQGFEAGEWEDGGWDDFRAVTLDHPLAAGRGMLHSHTAAAERAERGPQGHATQGLEVEAGQAADVSAPSAADASRMLEAASDCSVGGEMRGAAADDVEAADLEAVASSAASPPLVRMGVCKEEGREEASGPQARPASSAAPASAAASSATASSATASSAAFSSSAPVSTARLPTAAAHSAYGASHQQNRNRTAQSLARSQRSHGRLIGALRFWLGCGYSRPESESEWAADDSGACTVAQV